MEKQNILIVDDSMMNRELLTDILESQYNVREAENGAKAVEILGEDESEFWFVLLDIMMPEMDGFEVLDYIKSHYWSDRVVVVMISADDSPENITRAYNQGAIDYISRPFDPIVIRKRVANTLLLYARQHDLEKGIKEQFYEQQKNNDLMISILSHIVEFRNGESGAHVQNVKMITELLLKQVLRYNDQYSLSEEDIALISMASALHDIGKISISEEILNKPGRLTKEEFEVIKTHSDIGSRMLSDLPIDQQNSPLVKVAYEICRWHHERYDGRGYPDGLVGEEIPISAQVVSLADVYDALTSKRCYKKAFSHEEALKMILGGECGAFNPILLHCLEENADRLKKICNDGEANSEEAKKIIGCTEDKTDNGSASKAKTKDSLSSHPGYMKLLYVDALTKLYNRRYYEEHILNIVNVEAIAIVDIDMLDNINNEYGTAVGDLVLRSTAEMLSSLLQKKDYLIRYGGDEFLIVFTNVERDSFEMSMQNLKQHFDGFTLEDHQLNIKVKIGAVYRAENAKNLFRIADDMLKRSQNTDGVTVSFADENGVHEI